MEKCILIIDYDYLKFSFGNIIVPMFTQERIAPLLKNILKYLKSLPEYGKNYPEKFESIQIVYSRMDGDSFNEINIKSPIIAIHKNISSIPSFICCKCKSNQIHKTR